jgi:hypothetical protein
MFSSPQLCFVQRAISELYVVTGHPARNFFLDLLQNQERLRIRSKHFLCSMLSVVLSFPTLVARLSTVGNVQMHLGLSDFRSLSRIISAPKPSLFFSLYPGYVLASIRDIILALLCYFLRMGLVTAPRKTKAVLIAKQFTSRLAGAINRSGTLLDPTFATGASDFHVGRVTSNGSGRLTGGFRKLRQQNDSTGRNPMQAGIQFNCQVPVLIDPEASLARPHAFVPID